MTERRSPFLESLPEPRVPPMTAPEKADHRRRMATQIQSMSSQLKRDEIRRRRYRRWSSLGLAVAAAAGLWFSLNFDHLTEAQRFVASPGASGAETAPSQAAPPPEAARVAVGAADHAAASPEKTDERPEDAGRIVVDEERSAGFVLEAGAKVSAAPSSVLRLARSKEAGRTRENIQLSSGRVDLAVPKLTARQRLTVTTAEALVEVRGTEFAVSRRPSGASHITRVTVTEGLVAVTPKSGAELLLRAGESWQSSSVSSSVVDVRKASSPATQLPVPAAPKTAREEEEAARVASLLAEQNRIYQAALHAQRHGLSEAARARFEELLTRFPASPLAPSAKRQLQGLIEEGAP